MPIQTKIAVLKKAITGKKSNLRNGRWKDVEGKKRQRQDWQRLMPATHRWQWSPLWSSYNWCMYYIARFKHLCVFDQLMNNNRLWLIEGGTSPGKGGKGYCWMLQKVLHTFQLYVWLMVRDVQGKRKCDQTSGRDLVPKVSNPWGERCDSGGACIEGRPWRPHPFGRRNVNVEKSSPPKQ